MSWPERKDKPETLQKITSKKEPQQSLQFDEITEITDLFQKLTDLGEDSWTVEVVNSLPRS